MNAWAIAAAISCLLAIPLAAAAEIVVIDGDTFDLDGTRYRIHGIDAPEAGQKCKAADGDRWDCGKMAIEAVEELIFSATEIRCADGSSDGYGRTVAVCWVDGVDLGGELVRRGLAWSFVKYSHDYDADEAMARAAGEGIWRAHTQTAWEFRDARWSAVGQEVPDPNCPIKGNINREGERIYHTPWSPVYDRTKVSSEDGERWFCDEAQAVAAGWRQAYWGRRGG